MNTRADEWATTIAAIEAIGIGDDGYTLTVDDNIIELVAALNLLGLPTIGSCGGHLSDLGDGVHSPFVAIGRQWVPSRLRGTTLWDNPRSGNERERRYFAARARRFRPLGYKLSELVRAFSVTAEGTRTHPLEATTSWWFVHLVPCGSAGLTPEQDDLEAVLTQMGASFAAFGQFLKRGWLEGQS